MQGQNRKQRCASGGLRAGRRSGERPEQSFRKHSRGRETYTKSLRNGVYFRDGQNKHRD